MLVYENMVCFSVPLEQGKSGGDIKVSGVKGGEVLNLITQYGTAYLPIIGHDLTLWDIALNA
jgi:hypothetical protein